MGLVRDALPADRIATLSAPAAKALGPGPGRMMAARGMAALAKPGELLTVLYQIAAIDPALAITATNTADGLPDKVLAAAFADATVDARVLDWMAKRAGKSPALIEALVLAPAVADDTIADLAAIGSAAAVDLIAGNEQRLLRSPAIIAAMYGNPAARMSTVDRAVEQAVRAGVRVSGISAWDELARVVTGAAPTPPAVAAAADAAFAQALAATEKVSDAAITEGGAVAAEEGVEIAEGEDKEAPDDKDLPIDKLGIPGKIRLATLGNAFARAILIRDPMKMVAVAAIKSPGVTENEAAKYAGNHSLAHDVIRYISGRRDWTRLYGVKKSLVLNPKTPLTESTKLLMLLRDKDVRQVAKSRGVPSAVVAQARKIISQRTGGK